MVLQEGPSSQRNLLSVLQAASGSPNSSVCPSARNQLPLAGQLTRLQHQQHHSPAASSAATKRLINLSLYPSHFVSKHQQQAPGGSSHTHSPISHQQANTHQRQPQMTHNHANHQPPQSLSSPIGSVSSCSSSCSSSQTSINSGSHTYQSNTNHHPTCLLGPQPNESDLQQQASQSAYSSNQLMSSTNRAGRSQEQAGTGQNSSPYKTELCRPFEENGTCKYGEKCQFAHGQAELRTLARHPKYKTEFCRTFHTTGFCPYGRRCHFIHNGAPSAATAAFTVQNPYALLNQSRVVEDPGALTCAGTNNSLQEPAEHPLALAQQEQKAGASSHWPASSSQSVADSSCSSSSCSSSSGKGTSSPPALSSSPDSSVLGSSSSSPNHLYTQKQPAISRRPLFGFLSESQAASSEPMELKHQQQKIIPVGGSTSSFFGALDAIQRLDSSNDGQLDEAPASESHAFLWLHSQLNGGKSSQEPGSFHPQPNLSRAPIGLSERDEALEGCGRWPSGPSPCSNLFLSANSLPQHARRTWHMQA